MWRFEWKTSPIESGISTLVSQLYNVGEGYGTFVRYSLAGGSTSLDVDSENL